MEANNKKGITLLITILAAGVLLSVSLSIFNIAMKELIISATGRESQVAFYAADSGIECFLFWDYKGRFDGVTPEPFHCADQDLEYTGPADTFQFNIPDSPACVVVSVDKTSTEGFGTIVESRGYNSCDTSNPRRTERGIRLKY